MVPLPRKIETKLGSPIERIATITAIAAYNNWWFAFFIFSSSPADVRYKYAAQSMKITARITNKVKIQATKVHRAPLTVSNCTVPPGGSVGRGPTLPTCAKLIRGSIEAAIPEIRPATLEILFFIYVFLFQRPF